MRFAVLASLFAFSGCLCATPVQGTKVGVITSLSDEGMLCSTHEGVLTRGGLSGGSGALGSQTSFNIANGSVFADAQRFMEAGTEVEVTFDRPFLASACDREHEVDVTVTAIKAVR